MKRKSLPGFIVGLIGLLAGIPIGFYMFYTLILIYAFSGASLFMGYLPFLIPVAGILVIIALCFYLTKARIGALFMTIAFVIYALPLVLIFTLKINILEMFFPFLIGIAPAIMFLVAAILGYKAKPIAPAENQPESTQQ